MLLVAMYLCWAVLIGVWAVGALYNARYAPTTIKRQSSIGVQPWQAWILAAAGVVLLRTLVPGSQWAAIAFKSGWLEAVGLVLLVGSTAFTIWARWTLGKMWSSFPALREHHELHTNGPYRLTRHPIYTGILGMLLGSALVTGAGEALVPLLLFTVVFLVRIPREEKLMVQTFGEQYVRYQQEVPRLVPFLRV